METTKHRKHAIRFVDEGSQQSAAPLPAANGESKKVIQGSALCQWSMADGDQFVASGVTFERLKTGLYSLRWFKGNPAFETREFALDELYVFPGSAAESVLQEVDVFWNLAYKYEQHNLLHRRGFLLHGSQGHGKTSIIKLIIQDMLTKRDGVVLLCNTDPDLIDVAIRHFRQVEPLRNIMCVYEDIDAMIESWGEESLLSILDGENQTNHVLSIATSNYPDKLDFRLTNRPRRFDTIIKLGVATREERDAYFLKKTRFVSEEEHQMWLDSSSEFSFAALAEMVIAIRILGHDFDLTINRLRVMMKNKAIKKDSQDVGFGH